MFTNAPTFSLTIPLFESSTGSREMENVGTLSWWGEEDSAPRAEGRHPGIQVGMGAWAQRGLTS
jgi:hypothetical protein